MAAGGEAARLSLVFLPSDGAADAEVKFISLVGLLLLVPLGGLGYALHASPWLGPRRLRRTLLAALLPALVLAPLGALQANGGPLRSKMAHFCLSFFGIVAFFRWLELLCGTGPKGFDRSFKNFVVYFTSPAEVLFDADGNLLRASAPGRDLVELALRVVGHMAAATAVLSLGRATAFAPFLEEGADPWEMPWFGLPRAFPAIYLQSVHVYCMLATAMLMHRIPMALVGIQTQEPFRAPLLLSTSARDFWGRRWNLLIHRLMKRTFFQPLASRGRCSKQVGGLLAFLMSALFHEYMWLMVNWPDTSDYVPGLVVLFFLAQFAICAAEAALARTFVGGWAAGFPRPLRTVATTCILLPLGPLFLQGIRGMAHESAEHGQTVAVVRAGGALPEGAGFRPPIDWLVMALVCALIAAARARRRLLRGRHSTREKGSAAAVVPVADNAMHGA